MTRGRLVLFVLFFGSVWGAVEAILGGALHRAQVPQAAVSLTIIAFAILTFARIYCPQPGSSTLIASCAMLFKFVNAPFWGCHLLGIFLLGAAFDLVLLATGHDLLSSRQRIVRNALFGVVTTYLGFALFAVLITYVFRYDYWAREGLPRVLNHIFVGGTMAALGSAIAVPCAARLAEVLKASRFAPLEFPSRLATGGISLLMLVLWGLAVTISFS